MSAARFSYSPAGLAKITPGRDLLAVSRPNHILARLGFPYARHLQRRFASDSLRAMQRASAG
jgi:Domain of unknown function (DUF1990)